MKLDIKQAHTIIREVEAKKLYNTIHFNDIYIDIFEMIDELQKIYIPSENELIYINGIYRGYEYIHSFAKQLRSGKTLTEKQITVCKKIASEIKKAYLKIAGKEHPDKCPDKSPEGIKKATEKFQHINYVYGVLSDDEKKQKYDQFAADQMFRRRYRFSSYDRIRSSISLVVSVVVSVSPLFTVTVGDVTERVGHKPEEEKERCSNCGKCLFRDDERKCLATLNTGKNGD